MTPPVIGLLVLCALLGAALAWREWRSRRTMNRLDIMLDKAIRGDFEPERYDESQLSKLESKLERFLAASRLKRGQIEEEQKTVHTLIGDISHQTKTPIANILLYSQLLAERETGRAQTEELVEQLIVNAEKLNFLVQSLVKVSRLESGVIKIFPQSHPLEDLVEAALQQVSLSAEAKDVALRFVQPESPIHALFDPKWCAEALFNILDNGVKYTPAGGTVSVSIRAYEMFACIHVADTGPGLSEEELPRVFSRFWRSTANAGAEGVGIGLYLSREIVTACGGYIRAASTPGGGATFSVFLPMAPNLSKL